MTQTDELLQKLNHAIDFAFSEAAVHTPDLIQQLLLSL